MAVTDKVEALRGEVPLSSGTSNTLVDTKSSKCLLGEIQVTIRAAHALVDNNSRGRLSVLGNADGASAEWVSVRLGTHHAVWESDNSLRKSIVGLTAGTKTGLVESDVACAWGAWSTWDGDGSSGWGWCGGGLSWRRWGKRLWLLDNWSLWRLNNSLWLSLWLLDD